MSNDKVKLIEVRVYDKEFSKVVNGEELTWRPMYEVCGNVVLEAEVEVDDMGTTYRLADGRILGEIDTQDVKHGKWIYESEDVLATMYEDTECTFIELPKVLQPDGMIDCWAICSKDFDEDAPEGEQEWESRYELYFANEVDDPEKAANDRLKEIQDGEGLGMYPFYKELYVAKSRMTN